MKVKSESEVAQSCPTLSDPMDRSLPGTSSIGFSRQEYWSELPLPSPTTVLYKLNFKELEVFSCLLLSIFDMSNQFCFYN